MQSDSVQCDKKHSACLCVRVFRWFFFVPFRSGWNFLDHGKSQSRNILSPKWLVCTGYCNPCKLKQLFYFFDKESSCYPCQNICWKEYIYQGCHDYNFCWLTFQNRGLFGGNLFPQIIFCGLFSEGIFFLVKGRLESFISVARETRTSRHNWGLSLNRSVPYCRDVLGVSRGAQNSAFIFGLRVTCTL